MLEMKPEIRKQWCDALRSGDYTQARGDLRIRNEDGTYSHCCLGVLTDLYVKAGNPEGYRDDVEDVTLNVWEDGTLANPVSEWAGLRAFNPSLEDDSGRFGAAEWNDDMDADFRKIADMIDDAQSASLAEKLRASLVIREPKG